MVKVVLIFAALVGHVVGGGHGGPVGLGFGLNFALGGNPGVYGQPQHGTILVSQAPRYLVGTPVVQTVLAHHHNGLALQGGYAQQVLTQHHQPIYAHPTPVYAPVQVQHHHHQAPVHAHYSAPHQNQIVYGPPPNQKVYNVGFKLDLGSGGKGGYAVEAPVVKSAVGKKPVVSLHNYDLAPFKPIFPPRSVYKTPVYDAPAVYKAQVHEAPAVYKAPVYEAPTSEYSITPSISYGYSYKLVPTHSYGPIHSEVPAVKVAKAPVLVKTGSTKTLGLDLGFDIGHGHH